MFAEKSSLWHVNGFLLPCPAFPENIPDICLHASYASGSEKEALACVISEDSAGRTWNHGISPGCSVTLVNSHFTRTCSLPPMCHSPPFLPHPRPSRGPQGHLSGCQPAPGIHLSCAVSLTTLPVRHGAPQRSEEYVVREMASIIFTETPYLPPHVRSLYPEERLTHLLRMWIVYQHILILPQVLISSFSFKWTLVNSSSLFSEYVKSRLAEDIPSYSKFAYLTQIWP